MSELPAYYYVDIHDPADEEKAKRFRAITDKMLSVYLKKNADYGNSFEKSLDEFGPLAYVVRANDKMERIKQLAQGEARVKDESFRDTVLDLANYSIMFLMWEVSKDE